MPENSTAPDIDAWIASGDRPETTVSVCLAGKVRAAWEAKAAEIVKADEERKTLSDGKLIRKLTGELEQIRQQMEAESRTFRLRAVEPYAYQQLLVEHPPREGNQTDEGHGVNIETFYPVLVEACCVDPQLTAEQWDALRQKLNSRQWDELWGAARQVNRGEVAVPKSFSVSDLTRGSDRT